VAVLADQWHPVGIIEGDDRDRPEMTLNIPARSPSLEINVLADHRPDPTRELLFRISSRQRLARVCYRPRPLLVIGHHYP
jgi:hypothetical protein